MSPTTKSEATEFIIGTDVVANEGGLGKLSRVVVDPIARAITHLVVKPNHGHGTARLVPVGLVSSATADTIRLECAAADFSALGKAEETHFVQGARRSAAPGTA